jgi:hypothetical protein
VRIYVNGTLTPPSGGGFANPMTTLGDLIAGKAGGAPDRLAAGAAGYILRVVSGQPAWREISAAGLSGVRPAAAATREGQTYWSTDAAAGAQLSICVHKGGATYAWELLAYGAPGLPVATGAGEVPLSTGAGTAYAAANFGDEVASAIAGGIGGTAGQTFIGDGAGDIQPTSAPVSGFLASTDAPAMRSALCDRAISLAGLTPSNGTGTAVAATGTLSYASGQTGLVYADFPRLVGAHGTSIWSFDASARITITGTASNQTAASLAVGTTGSVYNAVVMIRLFGDGGIDGLDISGIPVWSVYTPGTLPVDGTGWLRVRVQAGTMTFWTGVGATYATAAWTIRYRALLSSPPSPDTTYPSLALALYQAVNPGVPGVQAVYSNCTIRDLP